MKFYALLLNNKSINQNSKIYKILLKKIFKIYLIMKIKEGRLMSLINSNDQKKLSNINSIEIILHQKNGTLMKLDYKKKHKNYIESSELFKQY